MEDVATRFRDLDTTREPLYWYLNMRRAGTMLAFGPNHRSEDLHFWTV